MADLDFDLLVIGGGINGAAVARDAAGRGLKVMLAECGDYGGATSSASSKLAHGGLRYLESWQFSLVRESLRERAVLLRTAPLLVRPLRFLVPVYDDAPRPAWMVRLGLVLYDLLAGAAKPAASGALGKDEIAALPHLNRQGLKAVLHYADCQVDDARLVLLLMLDARLRGADIANRRAVTAIRPLNCGYAIDLDEASGVRTVTARFVVNAAGPWANRVNGLHQGPLPQLPMRLVRGSHILLPMPKPAVRDALTVQMKDGRVVFVIPWFDDRHLMVGTTDVPHEGDPGEVTCSDEERDYLLDAYNRVYPGAPATARSVLWTWAGVRPLVDDGAGNPSKITRDSRLLTHRQGSGGFVTIHGGKLTSHRRLAEKVMDALAGLGCTADPAWTALPPLPGADETPGSLEALARSGPRAIPIATRRRLCATYGGMARAVFRLVRDHASLAVEVAPGVCRAEIVHTVRAEDVVTAEDFLYRRTKLFLVLSSTEQAAIGRYIHELRSNGSSIP